MKLLSRISLFSLIVLLGSCKASNMQSGILSDPKGCDESECPTIATSISGSLSIESDQSSYVKNVDEGDIIEISGKCSDLGIRQNRIMVEVYEGEDTSLSTGPYINNALGTTCSNSSETSALNGQKCFWITEGKGVIDGSAEYPQCYNGRFSFSVRLGRVLRDDPAGPVNDASNARKKYLVRFQLTTQQGTLSASPWASATVERGLTKPVVTLKSQEPVQASADLANQKCKFGISAFKNISSLSNISYSAQLIREYVSASSGSPPYVDAPIDIYGNTGSGLNLAYPIIPESSVLDWTLIGSDKIIIPGVKHKLRVTAYDKNSIYNYARTGAQLFLSGGPVAQLNGALEYSVSDEKECQVLDESSGFQVIANITGGKCSPGAGETQLSLKFLLSTNITKGTTGDGSYWDWRILKNENSWSSTDEAPLPYGYDSSANKAHYQIKVYDLNPGEINVVLNSSFTPGPTASTTVSVPYSIGTTCTNSGPTDLAKGEWRAAVRYVSSTASGNKTGKWSLFSPAGVSIQP